MSHSQWNPNANNPNQQPVQQGGFQQPPPGYPQQPPPGFQQPPPGYQPQHGGYPQQQAGPEMQDDASEGSLNTRTEFDTLVKLPQQAPGERRRFALVLFDDKDDPRFKTKKMFYSKLGEKNYPFSAPKEGHPLLAHCMMKWRAPQAMMGFIVLTYDTDRNGMFFPGATSISWMLQCIVLSPNAGRELLGCHLNSSLKQSDLHRVAKQGSRPKDVDYSFAHCGEPAWRRLPQETQTEILTKAEMLHRDYLGPLIGRPRPDHEVEALLRDMDPAMAGNPAGGQPPQNLWGAPPGAPQMGYGGAPQMVGGPQQGGWPGQQPQFGAPPPSALGFQAPQGVPPAHGFSAGPPPGAFPPPSFAPAGPIGPNAPTSPSPSTTAAPGFADQLAQASQSSMAAETQTQLPAQPLAQPPAQQPMPPAGSAEDAA